jgi:hypothetical protein
MCVLVLFDSGSGERAAPTAQQEADHAPPLRRQWHHQAPQVGKPKLACLFYSPILIEHRDVFLLSDHEIRCLVAKRSEILVFSPFHVLEIRFPITSNLLGFGFLATSTSPTSRSSRWCRMTLLLGPPGSGKTTLLLALAGRLDKGLKLHIFILRKRNRTRA